MQTPTILSQAQWIWPCGTLYLLNSYAGFRYDLDMQKLPSEAPFLITADQSYKLHVNGQYVCRGPVRGTQSNWHFDIVDILKFLHTGHNWISIEAFTPGKSTYFYNHKDAAGMLCSANWDNGIQIYSNVNSWQIFRNTAYNSNTAQLSLQMGQMEELDLLYDDRSWITEENYTLPPVMRGILPTAKNQGALPWTKLSQRPIPLLEENCIAPEKLTASGNGICTKSTTNVPGIILNTVAEFVDFELDTICYDSTPIKSVIDKKQMSFTLPAAGKGKFSIAVIDLGATQWLPGVPLFEIGKHDEGTILDVFYNQYMKDGKISYAWNPSEGSRVSLASRIHLNGKTNKFELFQIMGVRHVIIVLRENLTAVEIKLSWRTAVYPMNIKGYFTCSDPILNDIYNISVHSQRVCALDAFVDTPWREQSQWWGDARVQSRNTIFLSGDVQLLKRGIASIAEQKNQLNLTFANAPTTDCGPLLPDFCLTWVITLRDYWFQTKDTELFKKLKNQADSIFSYFENIRGSHGLLKYDPRVWLFEDWSTLPKSNTPTFLNLWYIYTREKYHPLLKAAGFIKEAENLKQSIILDKKLVKDLLFDQHQQLFLPELNSENKLSGPPSVHDQVLGLLLDIVPSAADSMIEKVIRPCLLGNYQEGAVPSAFWASYLLDCAQIYGLREEAITYIKNNWEPMISAGTTWENFPNPNPGELSCAHAWSAHIISHLPELVFGLKQLSPGWEEISLDFHAIPGIEKAEFKIPLPLGELYLSYDGKDVKYEIPLGIKLKNSQN